MTVRFGVAFLCILAAGGTGCAERALILRSPVPIAHTCIDALSDIATGASLSITTSKSDVEGHFVSANDSAVVIMLDSRTPLEIPADDLRRIVQIGKSRAGTYAKRGLLIGAMLAVATAIRSEGSPSWTVVAAIDLGGIGAGIGAAAGASAHEAIIVCDVRRP